MEETSSGIFVNILLLNLGVGYEGVPLGENSLNGSL